MTGLAGRKVLVAEDEVVIALDIALEVGAKGGEVLGPVATVAEAAALVPDADAAILDANLLDGDIDDVLRALVARGVPVVVCTGSARPLPFEATLPNVPIVPKPALPADLIRHLIE